MVKVATTYGSPYQFDKGTSYEEAIVSSDKEAKRKRLNNDGLAIVKQLTICKFYNTKISSPVGVFRKRKALNCGRVGCKLCTNPRRLWGHLTFPEKKANISFKYELRDI